MTDGPRVLTNDSDRYGEAVLTERKHPYKLGKGHVLSPDHDPAFCTACAYDLGRQEAADG